MATLPSVFVSYSREDSNSIQYAVGLLEAGGADVFRDLDDIRFGERWEDVLTSRIKGCERMLVFWSKAAQQSEWVGREYKMALDMGKTLVPILLDNTPLPTDLSAFHALTLANFMPKAPRWKRYGGWVMGGVAMTALVGVLGVQFLQVGSEPPPAASMQSEREAATAADNTEAFEAGETAAVVEAPMIEVPMMEPSVGASADAPLAPQNESMTMGRAEQKPMPMNKPKPKPAPDNASGQSATQYSTEAETAKHEDNSDAMTEMVSSDNNAGVQWMSVLPWIIGILVLLSLCWLALRHYLRRDELANSERFVEMVFDDHQAL